MKQYAVICRESELVLFVGNREDAKNYAQECRKFNERVRIQEFEIVFLEKNKGGK